MTVQHPIITYRLRSNGTIPSFLCNEPGAFNGMYGVNTNKEGFIPVWLSPQETKYIGMACGPVDPDGCPKCVEVIETKEELETYITGISTTWTVKSTGVTGVSTETTTGSLEAWNAGEDYEGPALVVTTTEKVVTADPAGTVVGVTTSYADSVTTTDIDGVVAKTVVRTYTETTEVENPFDPIAAADELWTKYETVNGL
jgi:hypothetical protein